MSTSQTNSGSIFSQKLDRVAFTAYFLGAVMPLIALAVVVERYVFPALGDRLVTLGLISVVVCLAVLSLGSFLVLRRTTRESLRQMDRDNQRLALLFEVASSLTRAHHESDAAATSVRCALALSDASGAFLYSRDEKEGEPALLESAGEDVVALQETVGPKLAELAALVIDEDRPLVQGPTDAKDGRLGATAILPLAGERLPMGALAVVRVGRQESFEPAQIDAIRTLAGLSAVALHNADLRDTQRNFFSHMTDMLVTALDSHLGYHKGHSHRVARLANRIGREFQLDDERLQRLHFAALLHDIGLLRLDRSVQKNSKACEKHTLLGYKMLGQIRLWHDVAPVVLHHHEWWNGHGYPERLEGESIPLESRIIAVCDAYDTMTSDSSYKVASTHRDAREELERAAGTQFDTDVVEAFGRLADAGLIDSA